MLWKSLEMWQQRAGLGNSPRTILEELARIQSHQVRLTNSLSGLTWTVLDLVGLSRRV
jgi:hypothetical protein